MSGNDRKDLKSYGEAGAGGFYIAKGVTDTLKGSAKLAKKDFSGLSDIYSGVTGVVQGVQTFAGSLESPPPAKKGWFR